jgi:DNA-binding NtrC family response regulator
MQTQSLASPAVRPLGGKDAVRILVAADRVAARLALKAVLEKSGYLVDCAASYAEAMDKIENSQFDLVLCDMRDDKPAADRLITFAKGQEYRPATAHLQITGDDAGDYLEPVDVPQLLTEITDLLASRAADRALRTARRAS